VPTKLKVQFLEMILRRPPYRVAIPLRFPSSELCARRRGSGAARPHSGASVRPRPVGGGAGGEGAGMMQGMDVEAWLIVGEFLHGV
jgi:hypothetical protein